MIMVLNRTAVWFCWGEKHVREACRSAQTIDIEKILICPKPDFEAIPEAADAFDNHVVADDLRNTLLDKSRMLDYLPADDRVYVFLDTDTRVLRSLDFAFEKAEQHGIAVATAPHYNLSEFWGFGRVLDTIGVGRADQNQYNTGVIFFRNAPVTQRVFDRWRQLCQDFGYLYENDQPYFSLALEQEGILPYVLSSLYNFRGGFFEKQVGKVRIWHDTSPVPEDVNLGRPAWPPRFYSKPEQT